MFPYLRCSNLARCVYVVCVCACVRAVRDGPLADALARLLEAALPHMEAACGLRLRGDFPGTVTRATTAAAPGITTAAASAEAGSAAARKRLRVVVRSYEQVTLRAHLR